MSGRSQATVPASLLPSSESPRNATGIGPIEDDASLLWLADSSQATKAVGMLESKAGNASGRSLTDRLCRSSTISLACLRSAIHSRSTSWLLPASGSSTRAPLETRRARKFLARRHQERRRDCAGGSWDPTPTSWRPFKRRELRSCPGSSGTTACSGNFGQVTRLFI